MSDLIEQKIISAIFSSQRIALDFSSNYDLDLFINPIHKDLISKIIPYIKLYKTRPTKESLIEKHSSDDNFISKLNAFEILPYDEANFPFDLDQQKRKSAKQKLTDIRDSLFNDSLDDINSNVKLINKSISAIKALDGKKAFERKVVKDYVDTFTHDYIEKYKNPELGKGILTGYSMLDYVKNGLRPSDLIIIAGATGSGKSQLMSNMAIQIWMQNNTIETKPDSFTKGYNIAYFSLEMPYQDCFQRFMSRVSNSNSYGIRDAKLSPGEAQAVKQACKFMKKYPYNFDIIDVHRGFSVNELESLYQEILSDYIPDVIFIDYLGLMEDADTGSDDQDWLKLGVLAGKIHEFARTYNIPIVTAVQLNRIDPKAKSQIGLHRIGRSALIATHATLIIQIETREDEHNYDDFIYHIIKNRHGASNISHAIYKDFKTSSIIDKQFDIQSFEAWTPSEDISQDVSDILGQEDD